MDKPRIFLGSSGQQAELLEAITLGLEEVADVEPWTTTFNPGRSTLDRLECAIGAGLGGMCTCSPLSGCGPDWLTI